MNTVEGYSFPRNMPWGREFVEELSYSADLFVPVVRFGVDDRWTLDGWTPQTYAFVHMLVGWLVVPLLLAWLAGIIRRR